MGAAPASAANADWIAAAPRGTSYTGSGPHWRIDATTRNVIPIKVGSTPGDATFGDGAVWVPNSKDNTVSRIDATTNKVTAIIKVGLFPDAATFGEGSVWVANGNDNTVSRIQP